tara:strand:- start:129 stop:308 length:180 start_codon:yes stop_codon:yes gene_type:complete
LAVNGTVGAFAVLGFDAFVAPALGIWITVYCFAGIEGYDGKGCANGISGLIPTTTTTST